MTAKVILICGPIGSGKSTASAYFEHKHKAHIHKMSHPLYDILRGLSIPTLRENLSELSGLLRKHFGEDIMGKGVYEFINHSKDTYIIIEGVRRKESIALFREFIHHIIWIEAKADLRYQRMIQRGEKDGEQSLSRKEFDEQDAHEIEVIAREFRDMADMVIENNGTQGEFYSRLDTLL